MGMDVGGHDGGPKSEINVTPLVDVMLVLLIIFMVLQPMLQMGYDVNVPPNQPSDTPPAAEHGPDHRLPDDEQRGLPQQGARRPRPAADPAPGSPPEPRQQAGLLLLRGRRQVRQGHGDHGHRPKQRGQERRDRHGLGQPPRGGHPARGRLIPLPRAARPLRTNPESPARAGDFHFSRRPEMRTARRRVLPVASRMTPRSREEPLILSAGRPGTAPVEPAPRCTRASSERPRAPDGRRGPGGALDSRSGGRRTLRPRVREASQ